MRELTTTRRRTLAGLTGLVMTGLGGVPARASSTLTVLSHEAMKGAASTGPGGDVLAAWRRANDCNVNWITLDPAGIQNRLLRESSLSQTSLDVAYVQITTPQLLSMMEPMEPYLASDPIEGVDAKLSDLSPSLVKSLTYENAVRGMPVRVSTLGLIYNEALFEERGITNVPKTLEELADACRKLTFTRPDGSKVVGLLFSGISALSDGYTPFARCFGGDYITADLKVVADQPPAIQSLEWLAGLYKDGALAASTPTASTEDIFNWMQQGRAAIIGINAARLTGLNDPRTSKYPGKVKLMDWPMTAPLTGKVRYAGTLEPWSLVMPKSASAARRKLAWSFIRELMSPAATVGQALNGNGPTRISSYSDPKILAIPYMPAIANAVKYGHMAVPPFPNAAKVGDILVEAAQSVMLGRAPAQPTMADAATKARPLV